MKYSRLGSTLIALFLLTSAIAYAEIVVAPPDATTAETVRITVSGEFGKPCFEIESFSAVVENTVAIHVTITPEPVLCAAVITPWSVTEEIGRLPAGEYQVTATIDAPCCFPCNPPPCTEQASFSIAQFLAVDIRPGSCPNPISTASRGVLPVAVLGSVEFDVTQIDATTVRLAGVPPVRSGYDDVGFPMEPVDGIDDCDLGCAGQGVDGWVDLTLKFDSQQVLRALGAVEGGECRSLTLTGELQEAFGGTSITGEDAVLILEPRGHRARRNPR